MRVPTSATECASVASVLRPCPVANTRVRADSFGGTSTTVSPFIEQPVGDVSADAVAPLDRPRPFREAFREDKLCPVAIDVGGEPAAVENCLVAGHHLDRRRPFVRVDPDHHSTHC
ncbi:hypothetical protein [uncultured Jatrophihabitans sp.]|uniref:hypothetical protein n=1 Tax=uncultured Jatrophihabitans sp. TaxID=1610747 RepID=UPI0035CC905B